MNGFIKSCFQIDYESVEIGSSKYFVPVYAKHRAASQVILNRKYYEPMTHKLVALLARYRPGNMVHAGTFFGDMLPSFSQKCLGTVYAFEPVLVNYVLANMCVQENGLRNVALFNSGLGEVIGPAMVDSVDTDGVHRGGGSRIATTGNPTTILTIDSLSPNDLTLIQLDVEGFELQALRGARNTIEKFRPVILVEDNRRNCAEYLDGLGYFNAGKIPGLHVWATEEHLDAVAKMLGDL